MKTYETRQPIHAGVSKGMVKIVREAMRPSRLAFSDGLVFPTHCGGHRETGLRRLPDKGRYGM